MKKWRKGIAVAVITIIVCICGFVFFQSLYGNKSRIQKVITYSFSIPSSNIIEERMLNGEVKMGELGIIQGEAPINKEAKEHLKGYFTETELEKYTYDILYPYYLLCFRNELSMKPDGIKVEKSGDKYSFTFQMNGEKGKEQFEKKISGTLELDEYKKISYFKILDDEGLIKMGR